MIVLHDTLVPIRMSRCLDDNARDRPKLTKKKFSFFLIRQHRCSTFVQRTKNIIEIKKLQ